MNTKITIEPNSEAHRIVKEFLQQGEDFRKAVESGKVREYASKNQEHISQPVQIRNKRRDLSI